jgi:redox-sensitive bicupin YhaK (pirin superfamily)
MITIRKAGDRGHADHGWLDSRHTFSFAGYHDPRHMGFRNLRVINEDRVQPGQGFDTHGHRDMEILSYVLEGALEHQDSMGNRSVIRPGEVQVMSAGTGVRHSETNPSDRETVHFLQVWLLPARNGLAPGYQQKAFGPGQVEGRLVRVASPDVWYGSVALHADAHVYLGRFDREVAGELRLAEGRHAWVQVARGRARVNGQDLAAGDGAALSGEPSVRIEGLEASEVLVFDLA